MQRLQTTMQLMLFAKNAEGMLELVEQGDLRDDEDELLIPVVIGEMDLAA